MTNVFEIVTNGQINSTQAASLRVNSDEIIPTGVSKGGEALIIDKMDVAVCDGNGNWYRLGDSGVVTAAAGQPWSDLL